MRGCLSWLLGLVCLVAVVAWLTSGEILTVLSGLLLVCAIAGLVGVVLGMMRR
jgi:hypothetical protein